MPEIQVAVLVTFHVHSAAVVTATLPAPPAASIVACDNVSATVHFTGVGPVATVLVELQPVMAARAAPSTLINARSLTDPGALAYDLDTAVLVGETPLLTQHQGHH